MDRAGNGLTAILFCERQPAREQAALLAQLGRIDKRFVPIASPRQGPAPDAKAIADNDGKIARLFAAMPGTLYCCGPTCTLPDDGRPP